VIGLLIGMPALERYGAPRRQAPCELPMLPQVPCQISSWLLSLFSLLGVQLLALKGERVQVGVLDHRVAQMEEARLDPRLTPDPADRGFRAPLRSVAATGGGIMRWIRRIHDADFPRLQTCCSILVSDLLEAWLYLPAPEEGGLASSSFKSALSSGGSTSEAGDSVFAIISGWETTLENPKFLPRDWLRPA